MSLKPNFLSVDCTLTTMSQRARLPLAIAGLLLSAQTQAFLPTPASLVTTGALAPTPQAAAIANNTPNNAAQGLEKSNTEQLLAKWREQAATQNLAQDTTWRRLLYFFDDQKNLIGKKKDTSMVDEADFF